MSATAERSEAGVRAGLFVGPILVCAGIAWTAMAPSTASSAAVLVGLVTCFFATHRFGRLGPDEGPEAPSAEADAEEQERLRKEREDARARERAT